MESTLKFKDILKGLSCQVISCTVFMLKTEMVNICLCFSSGFLAADCGNMGAFPIRISLMNDTAIKGGLTQF